MCKVVNCGGRTDVDDDVAVHCDTRQVLGSESDLVPDRSCFGSQELQVNEAAALLKEVPAGTAGRILRALHKQLAVDLLCRMGKPECLGCFALYERESSRGRPIWCHYRGGVAA
eukprot:jgi/Botrbrau1/7194/Bobra.0300s0024.1